MELDVAIIVRRRGSTGGEEVRRTRFTESDLFEWAQQYIEDDFSSFEAVSVDIESIKP